MMDYLDYEDVKMLTKKGLTPEQIKKIYNKRYYEKMKNNNKIIKITCDCGGVYSLYTRSTHLKSKKHLKHVNNIV